VNTGAPSVEAYLIGFTGDAYGRELRLDFARRLRGEEKFDSLEALKSQIARDVDEAGRLDCVPKAGP
jgi:riboflavin kinase/FMN adenylyltransferase